MEGGRGKPQAKVEKLKTGRKRLGDSEWGQLQKFACCGAEGKGTSWNFKQESIGLRDIKNMGKECLNLCSQGGTTEVWDVGVWVSCGLALCTSPSTPL